MSQAKTIYDKIWEQHLIDNDCQSAPLLYIDRHFIHEVTSPQAFAGLRFHQRTLKHPELSFATMDHNVSTRTRDLEAAEETSRLQMQTLSNNCKEFGIRLFDISNPDNGVIHVIGPELGLTLPGMTIVCGDSHTSTHGAFGALAFGIGTSEVEHVLATQTLRQSKSKNMLVQIGGQLGRGVEAKDVVLALIGKIGTRGGQGYVIEYSGKIITDLSMEGRMTICNMSIEAGARAGLIAPDEKTYTYLENRDYAPKGKELELAQQYWQKLGSDEGAVYERTVELDGTSIEPQVTWGTNPSQVAPVSGHIPCLNGSTGPKDSSEHDSIKKALEYMDLKEGTAIQDIHIDQVFIGSCTNARIEDLRTAAEVITTTKKKKIATHVHAIVVPGSARVRRQAEQEGLDKIFTEAGFEWRHPGCSMCLAMNDDVLAAGQRCASTSNRNFEGRQGRGGRTHLVSPAMATAAALEGHFVDVREL